MLTGDAAATATTVARQIGLAGPVCPPSGVPVGVEPKDFSVYAGIFPEQKFDLVKAFQQKGHAVAMCGDGANDAPALRQAQLGIAVSTATDVAKAAAGVVLTKPGLDGIVACIKGGAIRVPTRSDYTLMILVNKWVTLIVLGAGLIITGHAVLTPLLQALSMLTNDFVTMARTADRARPSPYPNAWRVRNLTLAAVPLGSFRLLYLVAMLGVAWVWAAPEPRRDADADLRDAGLRRPGERLRVAGARASLELAPCADHAGGLALRCPPGRCSCRRRRVDEPASDKSDRPARGDDDRVHPGDGLSSSSRSTRAYGSIDLSRAAPSNRSQGQDLFNVLRILELAGLAERQPVGGACDGPGS